MNESITVKRPPPTTVEQCALIALAEYEYWRQQERTDLRISGMGAAVNIYAAITLGQMAPWHPGVKIEQVLPTLDERNDGDGAPSCE